MLRTLLLDPAAKSVRFVEIPVPRESRDELELFGARVAAGANAVDPESYHAVASFFNTSPLLVRTIFVIFYFIFYSILNNPQVAPYEISNTFDHDGSMLRRVTFFIFICGEQKNKKECICRLVVWCCDGVSDGQRELMPGVSISLPERLSNCFVGRSLLAMYNKRPPKASMPSNWRTQQLPFPDAVPSILFEWVNPRQSTRGLWRTRFEQVPLAAGGSSLRVTSSNVRACACCGQLDAKKFCSVCRKLYYCDKTCQKEHWKAGHNKQCSPT